MTSVMFIVYQCTDFLNPVWFYFPKSFALRTYVYFNLDSIVIIGKYIFYFRLNDYASGI